MKHVILVCGKMRSGKDQFAVYLSEELAHAGKIVGVDKFAQDLKDFCANDFKDFANIINSMVESISGTISGFCSAHFSQDRERGLVDALNKELQNFRIKPENWYEDKTPLTRSILQIVGTEIFRNRVEDSYWVNRLYSRVVSNAEDDVIMITDTRFPNELDAFSKEYLVYNGIKAHSVLVERNTGVVDGHASENSLDGYECFNYVVDNNGTLDDLRAAAKNLANDILTSEEC